MWSVPQRFDAVAPRASSGDGELDVSEQRYEVMYFVDLADDRIDDFKQGWGDDRRLDRRRRRRRSLELPRAHQRHRCRDRGSAGARGPAVPDPGHRPVRGDRRRACPAGGRARRVDRAAPGRLRRVAGGHLRGGRGGSGDGLAELFGQLGVQGVVTGGQTLNPSTAELLAAVEARQRRPGRACCRTTRTSSRWPNRSTRSTAKTVARRADPLDARGARRARGLRPRGRRRRRTRRDAPWRPSRIATRRGHPGGADANSEAGPVAAGDWIGTGARRRDRGGRGRCDWRRPWRCSSTSSTTAGRS